MKNLYKPFRARIVKIEKHSSDVKLFRLKKTAGLFTRQDSGLVFEPGQFVLLSHFGYGEAPFGVASSPYQGRYIDLVIRRAGCLTKSLHTLKNGDIVHIRGPYGHGFPIKFMEQKDVVMVTGGCGIPPIAALIEYIIDNRSKYNKVHLVYGARSPRDLLLKKKLARWGKSINVILTVDQADETWKGKVGYTSDIVDDIKVDHLDAVVCMCGPGPMMNAIEKVVRPLGIADRRIFVNMERKMQCGIGKCQHCVTGEKYVCQDGPVFNFDDIDKNWS